MPREFIRWLAGVDDPQIDRRGALRDLVATTSSMVLLADCNRIGGSDTSQEGQANFDIPQRNFTPEVNRWFREKEGKDTVYLWGQVIMPDRRLLFAASVENRVTIFSSKPGSPVGILFDGEACQLLTEQWVAPFLADAKNKLGMVVNRDVCGALFPTFRPVLVSKLSEEARKNPNLSVVKDGEVVLIGASPAIVKGGRRYPLNPGTSTLFGGVQGAKSVPGQFIPEIPESENKITFQEGEILVGPNGDLWLIQNSGRYKIEGQLGEFANQRYKNFRAHEVPRWVIEKLPQKEATKRFFEDQYGRKIDGWAPRLIVLAAGYESTSDSAIENFEKIVERLLSRGWREDQILYATYSFNSVPKRYTKAHSAQHVPDSREEVKQFVEWVKKNAPYAQIIGCGHSQGGDVLLHAAIAYPGSFCQVLTIDSPLKGVDQGFQNTDWFDLDGLGSHMGKVSEFYIKAGDDPEYGRRMEEEVVFLRKNGKVEVFNFWDEYDGLIQKKMAILENCDRKIGEQEIQLVWKNPFTSDPLKAHEVLLYWDLFIDELMRVVGRP